MRRLPILATLLVAAAVAAMIALGVWQVQRAGEKERLIAGHLAAASLPALDLDPLLERPPEALPPLSFRRVLVTCRASGVAPTLRGGRSRAGQSGYVYLLPCRPGAGGLAGRLMVNVGWAALPDDDLRPALDGIVAGTLGSVQPGETIRLTSARPAPPLAPAAPPRIEDVANNHLLYAVQWFFFAAAAALIYALALRRRRREHLPPDDGGPKGAR